MDNFCVYEDLMVEMEEEISGEDQGGDSDTGEAANYHGNQTSVMDGHITSN